MQNIVLKTAFAAFALVAISTFQSNLSFGYEPTPNGMGPTQHYVLVKVPYKHREAVRAIWHGLYASHGYGVFAPGSWIKFTNSTVNIQNNVPSVQKDHPVKFKTWVRDGVLFVDPMESEDEPEKLSRGLSTANGQSGSYNVIPNMPFMISAPGSEFVVVNKRANYAVYGAPKPIGGEALEYEVVGPLEIRFIYEAPPRGEECNPGSEPQEDPPVS